MIFKKLFRRKKKNKNLYEDKINYEVYVFLWYGEHMVQSFITFDSMETAVDFVKCISKNPNYRCTRISRRRRK